MKQKSTKKIMQQCRILSILLAEIKLKENEGTQRTSVKMRCSIIQTVPICVTEAKFSLGNLTDLVTVEVIEVRQEIEQTI